MSRRTLGLGLSAILAGCGLLAFAILRNGPDPVASFPRIGAGASVSIEERRARVCDRVELDEVASRVRFDLLVPDHEHANDGNLEEVWLCPPVRRPAVTLVFESGVSVLLGWNDLRHPAATWRGLARHEGSSVGTVRGRVALLVEPTNTADRPLDLQAAGGVEFVEGKIKIIVIGNHVIPVAELIAIAESLERRATA